MVNSWKPVVKVGNDPKWYDNSVRFATQEEALISARDLFNRWTMATEHSAVESDDPVNYRIDLETMTMTAVTPEEVAS